MAQKPKRLMSLDAFRGFVMLAMASSGFAFKKVAGTVRDTSGGVLPGVTVTVKNVDTGVERVVISNEAGAFRAPLLPRVYRELGGQRHRRCQQDLAGA